MARRTKYKYTTAKYKKETAQKLIELCIESMAPNVTADITSRPRPVDTLSLHWDIEDKLYIGYHDLNHPESAALKPKDWDDIQEFESEIGRKLWTSEGLVGRIKGMLACPPFKAGSLVDKMAIFLTSEVNISFIDFRKVFRYIFGVRDVELYAAIKELIKQQVATIASMRSKDNMATGPFILQAISCGRESLKSEYDHEWRKREGHGTWYDLLPLPLIKLDGLLMRMFMYCADDLDSPWNISFDHIKPFHTLDVFYNRKKGATTSVFPYLCELMKIQTRDMNMTDFNVDTGDEYAEYQMRIYVLDEAIRRNTQTIVNAMSNKLHPDNYQYLTFNQEKMKECEETATESDIQMAIQILNNSADNTTNADKICDILEQIPQVFSLKSLYNIFCNFNTYEEVVRRDVRSLCKKKRIISPGRGLYCSIQYAEKHFGKVGSLSETIYNKTLGDSIQESLMGRLEDLLNILNKECDRFSKPDKN